ncbi:hypothetical protein E1B28_003730 [Marasmius oreades]|uniref:Uncharacterized protein n=1 Tax=Marasmius oreades TaxID=181124 RepID=A0A9P8ABN7_9AGAR|nr:uncharacterized protein E1B28_003730 [Marasmius oreades]KAG7096283.1 hypothetical protein E1B28_003730 [Marasmius oreades]
MSGNKYTLTVNIATSSLNALKAANYKLCIAKDVNGKPNVVFKGGNKVLNHNEFVFEDLFRVSGTNKFEDGALVKASTDQVPILGGQEVILSPAGTFGPVSGPVDPTKPFTVHNRYTEFINFGVEARVGNEYNYIYVSPYPQGSGDVILQPKKKFLIWFDQTLDTETMFSRSVTNAIELDFTSTSEHEISFSAPKDKPAKGVWRMGPLPVLGQTYNPKTNTLSLDPAFLPDMDEIVRITEQWKLEALQNDVPRAITANLNGDAQNIEGDSE